MRIEATSSTANETEGVQDDDDDDDDDESDDDSDSGDDEQGSEETAGRLPTIGYSEFLQFLRLGCSGSPLQGYPTIIVIISTIPPLVCNLGSTRSLLNQCTDPWLNCDVRRGLFCIFLGSC